ncbi:MAG: hypothetical protein WBG86_15335, partial [Polyangiales bacterium]
MRLNRWKTATLGVAALVLLHCQPGPPYSITGTATLPTCDEPAAYDLTGTWNDSGVVTVDTEGCDGAQPGSMFESCSLGWEFTQTGDDIDILVDEEYIMEGRLCGTTLYLEGGWWLPVQDNGECTYEEDSAEEVGIQMGGSSLTVTDPDVEILLVASGTLDVQGSCAGSYAIV